MELSYTVLVTSDDADGQLIQRLASEWYEDGLLRDFAFVTPSSVDRTRPGPPIVQATPVGGEDEVELMRLLGNRRRELIRVVVLHALTHQNVSADELIAVCNDVATLVRRAMPVGATGDNVVKLLRINMLVPETDVAQQQIGLLQPGWEVNAVVSPEDRPDVDRLNVFIRAQENLHGHALAAAATLGGLWRGMHEAALDEISVDSTSADQDSVVVRCHVRLILGDDRADKLAQATIDAVIGAPDGSVRHLEWGYVSDRPDQFVDRSLAQLLRTAEWVPDERATEPLTKPAPSIWTVIGEWLRFQASLPLAAFRFLGSSAQDAAERGLTYTFAGSNVGVVGRLNPEAPRATQAHAAAKLTALSDALEPTRLAQDAAVSGQATPAAWRTLRELCIGLVDGSDLPTGFDRLRRAQFDEVLPPSYVAPAFGREVVNGYELRAVDVEAIARMAAAASPATEQGENLAVKPGKSESLGEPSDGDETVPDGPASPPTRHADDEAAPDGQGSDGADSSATTDDSFRSWVADRSQTLIWKLAKRVYEQRRSEQQKALTAQKTLDANRAAPAADSLVRARRVLLVTWTISLILLGIGVASYLLAPGPLDVWLTKRPWESLATWLVIIVAIFLYGGHHYYRAAGNYEWAVQQRLHTLRSASDEFVAASQQETRWQLMYTGVLDWGEIFAELLHRPWADPQVHRSSLDEPSGLPAAVAMAQPDGASTEPTTDMVAQAVERVCHRGWLREEFERATVRSRLNDPSSSTSTGDLAADLDLGLRRSGPRNELLEVVTADDGRAVAGKEVYARIHDLVARGEVRVPSLNVTRVGEYASGEVHDDRSFIASIREDPGSFSGDVFSDAALVANRHEVVHHVLTLPAGIKPESSTNELTIRSSDSFIATRVDVSGILTPRDLALFAPKDRADGSPAIDDTSDFN